MVQQVWRSLALAGLVMSGGACSEEGGIDALLAANFSGAAGSENYSGTWAVNRAKSTFPNFGGKGGGPGGPGGRAGLAAGSVTIAHSTVSIAFSYPDGRSVSFPLDGSVVKRDLGDGKTVSARAGWRDGHVVIERTNPRGGTLTQSLALGADGAELIMSMASPRGAGPRVVFDRQ